MRHADMNGFLFSRRDPRPHESCAVQTMSKVFVRVFGNPALHATSLQFSPDQNFGVLRRLLQIQYICCNSTVNPGKKCRRSLRFFNFLAARMGITPQFDLGIIPSSDSEEFRERLAPSGPRGAWPAPSRRGTLCKQRRGPEIPTRGESPHSHPALPHPNF
jgi:hypothetical protein